MYLHTQHRLVLFLILYAGSAMHGNGAAAAQPAAPAEARGESEQLYMRMHQVLTHPRCLNCHPKGDSPKQGELRRIHMPPITRGPADNGPLGLQCAACHQTRNYAASGVPGAPNWHLAPLAMAWEDKTPGELCRLLLDKSKNGNRDLSATVKHLTEDELVAWGWEPGTDNSGNARAPVPIPKPEFNRIVREWARLGAACPK
jgi:hypothetical protein